MQAHVLSKNIALAITALAFVLLTGCARDYLAPADPKPGNPQGTIPFPRDAVLGLVFTSREIQVFDENGNRAAPVQRAVDVRQLQNTRTLLFLDGSCVIAIPTPVGLVLYEISPGECPPGIVGVGG